MGLAATVAVAGGLAAAQVPQFATSVEVVEVYASVTNGKGEPVRGLRQDHFKVFEDGEPQVISTFVEADFPLSVAVAVDRSWSMAGERLEAAKAGARALLDELRPGDQAMVIAVSGEVQVVAPLSLDRSAQARAVDRLDPWSTTALHDAIVAAIDRVEAGTGRRALVLFSDAGDRYSQANPAAVLDRARRSDVMAYPVALSRDRSPLFAELAVLTGGRSFAARNQAEAATVARTIARELRTQYLLGYAPARSASAGAGEWRSIRVDVEAPGARVRARDGYVSR